MTAQRPLKPEIASSMLSCDSRRLAASCKTAQRLTAKAAVGIHLVYGVPCYALNDCTGSLNLIRNPGYL